MSVIGSPYLYNVSALTANTEYSQALASGHNYFEIKCRQIADLKLAFISGQSGTTYWTVPGGSTWYARGSSAGIRTLYFQSPSAGVVVEIMEWR